MTITNTTRSVTHTGNGSTTSWPYTFNIPDVASSNVKLVEIATGIETVISSEDYTISGLGNANGGSVTYPKTGSAIASTHQIVVYRSVAATQTTTITNQTSYNASVVMAVWDRIVMMVQELTNDVARALRVPVGESALGEMPALSQRASKFLAFDANGDPVAGTTVDTAVVTSFMETVLDDTTAAAARTTLGALGSADLIDETNARSSVLTTGAADVYTLTAASTITAYAVGQLFRIRIHALNTGAVTLNVDGLGAKAIQKYVAGTNTALAAGDLKVGSQHMVGYDGTRFILLSPTEATTSMPGIVEKSTSAENVAATDDTVFPSVAGVKELLDAKRTVLQEVSAFLTTASSGTTALPTDDTVPQITEGDEYLTVAITPKSTTSTLSIEAVLYASVSGAGANTGGAALFRDSGANALAATPSKWNTSDTIKPLIIRHNVISGSLSSTTFRVRAGRGDTNGFDVNSISTGRLYGGVMSSYIIVREIQ